MADKKRITGSEALSIKQILGIDVVSTNAYGVVLLTLEEFLEGYSLETKNKIIALRNKIDAMVDVQKDRADDLEIALKDLQYRVKELIYRIEERRDIRNDLHYKDLKADMRVM